MAGLAKPVCRRFAASRKSRKALAMDATAKLGTEKTRAGAAETPSGKGAADENFPVGSFLLPKRLRPEVATFYAFARAIDDIADNGALSADEKIARLKTFDAVLRGETSAPGYEKAAALRESMRRTGVPTKHGSDLIAAFVQDAVKLRYKSWDELLGYCALSANPVGRYLLDLHGEDRTAYRYSDALCTVLQIVNHLQDCGDDRKNLDRVYIIGDWLAEEGGSIDDLDKKTLTPAMRRVIDRMLDGCETMMADARLACSVKVPQSCDEIGGHRQSRGAAHRSFAQGRSARLARRAVQSRFCLGRPSRRRFRIFSAGRGAKA